jgi:sterol desaturase/sphingolipid hydroxylase (fatty acid hydroxylase superfamily)
MRLPITRTRWVSSTFILVLSTGITAALLLPLDQYGSWSAHIDDKVHGILKLIVQNPVLNDYLVEYFAVTSLLEFCIFFVVILCAEKLLPARKTQHILSVGFRHDFMWFLFYYPYKALVVSIYSVFLYSIYQEQLAFLRIESINALPLWALIIMTILASDFLYWLHHLITHKIQILWYFHTIHHSQREMNLFTNFRSHPFEIISAYTFRFIPFLSLQPRVAIPTVVVWEVFNRWHARFCHANIRTDLGWLRYFLVTPQSHRIHHSLEEKHRDKNFGVIFSIWDRAFGTQYSGHDEYPDTGIADQDFPLERTRKASSLFSTPARQFVYPFRLIFNRLGTAHLAEDKNI